MSKYIREILFRGKRLDNGEWAEGSLHIEYGETTKDGNRAIDYRILGMRGECYYVDFTTVGQYTGLKDKNGQRIFEGDILLHSNPFGLRATGCVCYGENEWNENQSIGFYMKWLTEEVPGLLRTDIGFWCNEREVEVISNIHDHPELLEGGD